MLVSVQDLENKVYYMHRVCVLVMAYKTRYFRTKLPVTLDPIKMYIYTSGVHHFMKKW